MDSEWTLRVRNAVAKSLFFRLSPLPFGGSTVLSLTRGPAGNRTTTGSLPATQECRDINCTRRTTGTRFLSLTLSPVLLSVSPFLWLRDCVTAGLRIAHGLWVFMPVRPTGCVASLRSLCMAMSLPGFALLFCCFSPYQSFQWCNRHHPSTVLARSIYHFAFRVGLFFLVFVFVVFCFCCCFCLFCFVWFCWSDWHCDDLVGLCIWSFFGTEFLVYSCPQNEHNY